MSLTHLEVFQVRNLREVHIQPSAQINLIFGENASGKTSLLEAIHLLSLGRSFRTPHIQHVIQHSQDLLRVTGRIQSTAFPQAMIPVGIERGRDHTQIRINGQNVSRISDLAAVLPVQVINPDVHKLLEQGPKYRRQFIDWGVFHVEQHFLQAWQNYHRILKQRNVALRKEHKPDNIRYWDKLLVDEGVQISRLREKYLEQLIPHLEEYCSRLLQLVPTLHYQSGWSQEFSFAEALQRSFERDRQSGFTQVGPHRADLVIKHQNQPAQARFSRGQQKMLVSAMRLAQIAHLKQSGGQVPVLLVDDLPAELDTAHRAELLGLLMASGAQLFVTTTEAELLDTRPWSEVKMFHVEHGQIKEVVY